MKDDLLYVDARGLQVLYNACVIALLWLTRGWRSGHWYFDAVTFTTPSNKVLHSDGATRCPNCGEGVVGFLGKCEICGYNPPRR